MNGHHDRWLRMVLALDAHLGSVPTIGAMTVACAQTLDAEAATIMLMLHDGAAGTHASSDAAVEQLADTQLTLGVGPGPEAHRRGVPVVETDLVDHPPIVWADFAAAAVDLGYRSVAGLPLRIGAARVGALVLYRSKTGALDDGASADALVMAGVITRTVLALQAGADGEALATELADGGIDHVEVHQASGVVSAQLGIDVGEALARLRARAFADGTSVRSVAIEVLARRLLLDP